jgi:predicted nucleic acid-binding protein
VLTEPTRRAPSEAVLRWLANTPTVEIALSVLSLGEIRHGLERMAAGERRRRIQAWLESELPAQFRGRLLSVDAAVADAWGRLEVVARTEGRPLPVIDGLLLATARVHSLTLISRDGDCAGRGVPVLDPWK